MGSLEEEIAISERREKLGCGWWALVLIMPLIALIIGLVLSAMSDERQRRIGSMVAKRSLIVFTAYLILSLLIWAGCIVGMQESTKTILKSPPSSFLGDKVEVVIEKYEFSGPFESSYGVTESPASGAKFLWLYVKAKNIGKRVVDVPGWFEFKVTYVDQEMDCKGYPYDRQGYPPFGSLGVDKLYPGVVMEGWIYWEVPKAASVRDLKVTYLNRKLTLPK